MMKPGAVVGTVLGALSLIMSFDAVRRQPPERKSPISIRDRRILISPR